MKKLELSAYGVEEIRKNEAKTINGGWIWIARALAIYVMTDLLDNSEEYCNDFMRGYNSTRNKS